MDVNMIFTMLGGSNRIETDLLKKNILVETLAVQEK